MTITILQQVKETSFAPKEITLPRSKYLPYRGVTLHQDKEYKSKEFGKCGVIEFQRTHTFVSYNNKELKNFIRSLKTCERSGTKRIQLQVSSEQRHIIITISLGLKTYNKLTQLILNTKNFKSWLN